jgi:integrase
VAKEINKLTTVGVKALKKPGRHKDGGNLYCVVSKAGARAWSFVYKFHGKQREAGLGSVDSVSLKDAREKARAGREMLARKPPVDPLTVWQAKKREDAPTFAEAAASYLDKKTQEWRSEKHARKTRSQIAHYCKPLMRLRVNEIATGDMEAWLRPLMRTMPESAMRLRGHVEAMINAAKARGHITRETSNPAVWKGHLDQLVAKPKTRRRHFPAVPYDRLPEFIRNLRERRRNDDGSINVPAYALEYLVLTATRSAETLGARWDEIDLEPSPSAALAPTLGPTWTLAPERMKADRPHRVPLSAPAMAIIEAMAAIKVDRCDFVFPGYSRATPIAGKSFERLLARMDARDHKGERATAHGFRSSFRDWVSVKTATPFAVAETALAHRVGDQTVQAYARDDLLEPRRPLMEAWGRYLDNRPFEADIIPLAARMR